MTAIATAKRTSSASFSAAATPVDHDRDAGDHVAAAAQLEAGLRLPLKVQARRGVVS